MLVTHFAENAVNYENFEVWDIDSFESFYTGNPIITEIATKEFKVVGDKKEQLYKQKITENIPVVEDVLDLINDKHFFVFTLHDPNHLELVGMQKTKTMDFGVDISNINPDNIYIVVMDKRKKIY